MIRLTLEFTDSLGPEADMGVLIARLDEALHGAAIGDAHVLVEARTMLDYVADIPDGAWASVVMTLRGPASLEGVLTPLRDVFLDLAETHLGDFFLRRSIALSCRLDLFPDRTEVERRRAKPPGPGF